MILYKSLYPNIARQVQRFHATLKKTKDEGFSIFGLIETIPISESALYLDYFICSHS